MIKARLEGEGIPAMLKNERGSALAGIGNPIPFMISMTFAWPEVWVNDEHENVALSLIAAMQAPEEVSQAPWICPRCRETIEGQFTTCWKCGYDVPLDEENP